MQRYEGKVSDDKVQRLYCRLNQLNKNYRAHLDIRATLAWILAQKLNHPVIRIKDKSKPLTMDNIYVIEKAI